MKNLVDAWKIWKGRLIGGIRLAKDNIIKGRLIDGISLETVTETEN